ncbi:APH domain-containing protein [Trichophyton interdigitale]|uniref:APH domain-containing protein n=1 Tax=Trichophyton interdigitale TaxID=101480 RepID=A0A9P4YFV4_9EURO|nr:APH domain-containing protein [Trichophyton interdigitale]KAF3893429.1 APH domain-containing protein [Trichophyton interdigitale]KAG8208045.1 APH domain-containing protein [Trichophyton interdigitale]
MVYREDVPFWTAKEAAHSTQLSAWEHLQLFFFLNHSFDRNKAGQFLLDKLAGLGPDESREKYLRSIIDDMRSLAQKFSRSTPISTNAISALKERQNGICHISGESQDLQPIHIVSPSVLHDDDLMPGTRLRELLDICVSPEVTDKLFSFMRSSESVSDDLKNLWLMSPAVAAAFREGRISIYKNDYDPKRLFWILRTTIPGNYNIPGVARNRKFSSMPSTPDDTQLPLPEGFLLDIHCHVSEFLYFLDIEKQIQAGWEIEDEYTGPCRSFRGRILRALFSMLPHFLRLKIMKLIVWAQDRWSPPYNKSLRHLPFGLCLKIGRRVMENEANALRLVEQHTQVPAPQLIGFAKDGLGDGYLLMSRVPGVPVDEFYYRMTYEERAQLAKDLKGHILQYRQIRNTSPYLICNTLGGPTYDHRTDTGEVWGPYRTKDEFTNMLTEGLEDLRDEPPLSALYKKRHRIFFTHSDLHYSNLFIHKGRLCGIVDWECASFKPEYWEFTRAVWSFMADRQREQNLRLAFDENYQEELEAERLIWSKNPVY